MKAKRLSAASIRTVSKYRELYDLALEEGTKEYGVPYAVSNTQGECTFVVFNDGTFSDRDLMIATNRLNALHFMDHLYICATQHLAKPENETTGALYPRQSFWPALLAS